jgi:DNA (cytosine-5)-methyltransferase 1
MLTFLSIADKFRPKWVVWENVPGVLSSNGGRDFGTFLGALGELGYGFAYRVLDAQYFGVAQRRRRVFVVGYLGDWRVAAAVLFERESLQGNTKPSRKKREEVTANTEGSVGEAGDVSCVGGNLSPTVTSKWMKGYGGPSGSNEAGNMVYAPTVIDRAAFNQGENAQYEPRIETGETMSSLVAKGPHAVAQPIAIDWRTAQVDQGITQTLKTDLAKMSGPCIAVDVYNQSIDGQTSATITEAVGGTNTSGPKVMQAAGFLPTQGSAAKGIGYEIEQAPTLRAGCDNYGLHQPPMAIRRLTPKECERLQGFPDDWTKIPYRNKEANQCPDGPRYKACGNSMAVPVMRWIGERINLIESIL